MLSTLADDFLFVLLQLIPAIFSLISVFLSLITGILPLFAQGLCSSLSLMSRSSLTPSCVPVSFSTSSIARHPRGTPRHLRRFHRRQYRSSKSEKEDADTPLQVPEVLASLA